MSNPFEPRPNQPPKPIVETPSSEPPKLAVEETPPTPSTPEVTSGVLYEELAPEQRAAIEAMLQPVQQPDLARFQTGPLRPGEVAPVVPSDPTEQAERMRRYNEGWADPVTPEVNPDEQAQKEREDLEKLRGVVELMDEFELKYPLQTLHAITNISLAELENHPVRKPANVNLVHIREAINAIGSKRTPEIDERYRRLSRAVGSYNGNTKSVDHDRG